MNQNRVQFEMALRQFSGNKRPEYPVIFGAGINGLWLKKILGSAKIDVDFFCENDTEK